MKTDLHSLIHNSETLGSIFLIDSMLAKPDLI